MTKLAVLDIGTNSIHLVLAEVEPDFSYKILDRFKDMTRLGDGTFTRRRLSEAAMTRALEVIRNLTTLARHKGYDRIEAVATSAVREAENGGEFIDAVARRTGLSVRVVTGLEEARLIYLGVRHSMELTDRPALIIDIGGGSVELIVGNRTAMVQGRSLKLGAIRLKDLYIKKDPPMLQEMQHAIDDQLKTALRHLRIESFERLVGTSGMINNMTEIIHLRRTGRPLPQMNLATVTLKEVAALEHLLQRTGLKERLAIPGLDAKRVDTLLPAAMVLRILMEQSGLHRATISEKAIREGVIYDFIERHREGLRAEQEIPHIRRRNVVLLARRCGAPESHMTHVAGLALRLFDGTKVLHGLGERAREWLEYAALLHDVGYLINARQHHKHTYYVIKHSDLAGLTAEEIEIIANVARYHRRAVPHESHASFKSLPIRHRRTVQTLGALLRIADGLDRSHFSVIQDVSVSPGKPVVIRLQTTGDPELEVWAARNRVDLFEKVFKRRVWFEVSARKREAS